MGESLCFLSTHRDTHFSAPPTPPHAHVSIHAHSATGSWRRRRALLVPHTFLYYFGEQTAATDLHPHGVIDLELYTDVQVVDGKDGRW